MKNTKNDFINVLVDCKGYSEQEALETQKEYRNDLESYLRDCGADDTAINECKEFIFHAKSSEQITS